VSPRAFHWLSRNPAKRATERFHLLYAPVWGGVTGSVMVTGMAERWGDVGHLTLGVLVFLGSALGPFVFAAPEDRGRPITERYAFKIFVWICIFGFLGGYYWTYFFFDVLHAHYGFQTRINLNNQPLALYFLTVTYFSTYAVLINIGWRVARDWVRPRWPVLFWPSALFACFAVAGLESAFNANPWMTGLYCFDDVPFALSFGTLAYGLYFIPCMYFWVNLGERDDDPTAMRDVVVGALAATMLVLCILEPLKWLVAPHFTEVRHAAPGLRDYGPGVCLTPPRT
jgi:hypothetical protein